MFFDKTKHLQDLQAACIKTARRKMGKLRGCHTILVRQPLFFIYKLACVTITAYGHIQSIAHITHIGAGHWLRLGHVPAGALVYKREEPRG